MVVSENSLPEELQGAAAVADDAWLGVHVLSEFEFCRRAGLNAIQQRLEDHGEEVDLDHVSNLDYEPEYEWPRLQAKLTDAHRLLLTSLAMAGVFLLAAGLCIRFGGWSYLVTVVPVVVPGAYLVQELPRWWSLVRQVHDYRTARVRLPDPGNLQPEELSWWGLLKAGFDVVRPHAPYRGEFLRLQGRPKLILRRAGIAIPVFIRRSSDGHRPLTAPGQRPLERDAQQLYRQHFVRIAAYCHLIEALEGLRSPFGIVLNSRTLHCLAIKYNAPSRSSLSRALHAARHVVRDWRAVRQPPAKPRAGLCAGCPYGKPLRCDSMESLRLTQLTGLEPRGEVTERGQIVRSACGDLFDWVPPHRDARTLGIPVQHDA